MNWFEKFSEEILVIPAYFFWQKFIGKEEKDKKSENSEDEN